MEVHKIKNSIEESLMDRRCRMDSICFSPYGGLGLRFLLRNWLPWTRLFQFTLSCSFVIHVIMIYLSVYYLATLLFAKIL